jgi:hypothetical protein
VSIALLVRLAARGDLHEWERIVDQYSKLIWSITVEYRLVESNAADVVDGRLLPAERDQTVRDAMSRLPTRWQDPACLRTVDPVLVLNTVHV